MRQTRSNKNGKHIILKPIPCSIKKLLKTSKKGKTFTYRRTVSGTRYKQYCVNTKQQKISPLKIKPTAKASLYKVGTIIQGYEVITVRKGRGRKKQWRKL